MEDGEYSTFVKTEDEKIYDLGNRQYPPVHHHPGEAPCPECFVVNAWAEKGQARAYTCRRLNEAPNDNR
jgi:hypothetical protein